MKYVLPAILFLFSIVQGQKLPTILEKTKEMKKYEGFLNYYWEEATGKIWLEIGKSQNEILYQQSLPAGLGISVVRSPSGCWRDSTLITSAPNIAK